jgi:hypothetical protein
MPREKGKRKREVRENRVRGCQLVLGDCFEAYDCKRHARAAK